MAGESGIAPTTLFDARTFPTTFSAEVKGFDFAKAVGASYERHKKAGRNTQFAVAAALQAWNMAGLPVARSGGSSLDPYAVGTYMGAGEGGLD
jgi:3-oxoacyl-[acyl-carrier-protein] synthase II